MSLRRSILSWISGLTLCVGLVAIVCSYRLALDEAGEFMDDQMRQYAELVSLAGQNALTPGALREPEDRFAVVLWTKDGTRIEASPEAPNLSAPPAARGFGQVGTAEAWRTFVVDGGKTIVMIAQRMSARNEIAEHAALIEALPIVLLMPLAWLAVSFAVGRVMRRLAAIGDAITSRAAGNFEPIPLQDIPREVRPFVLEINTLLARQAAVLDQQRRFVADAAHELRTPLAAIQIQIDNLASGAAQASDLDAVRGGTRRVGAMIDKLLRLSRAENELAVRPVEDLDLAEILRFCLSDLFDVAEASNIDLGIVTQDGPVIVRSNRNDLHTLFTTLIENAIHYSPRGGRVDCAIERHATHPRVRVSDNGPGVSAADLPRLTDRFFRGSNAKVDGSGLGLAIARAIADRNRIGLSFANMPQGSGLCVTVTIPASASS